TADECLRHRAGLSRKRIVSGRKNEESGAPAAIVPQFNGSCQTIGALSDKSTVSSWQEKGLMSLTRPPLTCQFDNAWVRLQCCPSDSKILPHHAAAFAHGRRHSLLR